MDNLETKVGQEVETEIIHKVLTETEKDPTIEIPVGREEEDMIEIVAKKEIAENTIEAEAKVNTEVKVKIDSEKETKVMNM